MIANANILVVEDDGDINNLLCRILQSKGYNAKGAFSGTEAKMCVEMYDYQLILLDLMLPGMTGEELIREIRKIKLMPIIVISAKTGMDTRVEVLKSGADDFIQKPFDNNEVLARVEAQLRRYMVFSEGGGPSESVIRYKNLELNRDMHTVNVCGKDVQLSARDFAILELMAAHPKKVFTRSNIFESVWGDEFMGDDNTINVHISNIRSRMAAADPDTEYIKTVWGIGFKFGE